MKSPIEILNAESLATTGSLAPMPADVAPFDEIWKLSLDDFAAPLESAAQGVTGPSMLTGRAMKQAALLDDAFGSMDMAALGQMSTVEVIQTMSTKKIAMDTASTLMTVNWSLVKSMRQSIDAVMNSK